MTCSFSPCPDNSYDFITKAAASELKKVDDASISYPGVTAPTLSADASIQEREEVDDFTRQLATTLAHVHKKPIPSTVTPTTHAPTVVKEAKG